MRGYMFAHMETWSRQGAPTVQGQVPVQRRNGQRAWTASAIIDEAERLPDASGHVQRAGPEPVIWPGTCDSFEALREAHDEAASVKLAFPYTDPKTGAKKTRRRAIRKDTPTLYAAVFSLPVDSAEALADPEMMTLCRATLEAARDHEKARIEDAGGEVAMSVLHVDEKKVHLHVFAIDRRRGTVVQLHPGKAANEAFRARHGALRSAGTTLSDQSKRDYGDAMRAWQDDLYRDVFSKIGLLRTGPRRQRLTRAEYCREMAVAEAAAEMIETATDRRRTRELLIAAEATVRAREDLLDAERMAFDQEQAEDSARRKADVEALAKERADLARRAGALAAEQDAFAAERLRKEGELEASLAAVEAMAEGLLDYDEAVAGQLKYTPGAKSDARMPGLVERLKRAPSAARSIARRLSGSLTKLRAAARDQARGEVHEEWHRELGSVRAASGSIAAIRQFAAALITRLPLVEQRREAAELDAIVRRAAADVADSERRVRRKGGEQERG